MQEEEEELQLCGADELTEKDPMARSDTATDDTVTLPPESEEDEDNPVLDGIGDVPLPRKDHNGEPHADSDAEEKQKTPLDPKASARLQSPSDAREKLIESHGKKSTRIESDTLTGVHDGVNRDIVSEAPTKREKRRAREAAKKAKGQTQMLSCNVCGEDFDSKTKLFAHIRDEGHAAATTAFVDKKVDQGQKRGKKRK